MANGPSSIAECSEWFRKRFQAEAARELSVAYRIELSGSAGGVLSLQIDDGLLRLETRPVPGPDVVYRLSDRDLFGILAGRANPDLLFMEGRIRIEGDLSLALKLRTLFRASA